ncbi:hypothetical protein [Hugenholtzia roseola]|uniref:hypothetical protein n=1 Tax=Hugenholtzia roseola TaxID=1002 RepID=UPI000417A3D7|nr:hypothetical protein [Hugenholtzia roseola]
MIQKLYQTLSAPWDFIRLLRLGLALLFIGSGIWESQMGALFLGGILLVQSLLNVGCGMGSCTPAALHEQAQKQPTDAKAQQIVYEEVLQKKSK